MLHSSNQKSHSKIIYEIKMDETREGLISFLWTTVDLIFLDQNCSKIIVNFSHWKKFMTLDIVITHVNLRQLLEIPGEKVYFIGNVQVSCFTNITAFNLTFASTNSSIEETKGKNLLLLPKFLLPSLMSKAYLVRSKRYR
jgi:hypothetical protein